MYVWNDAWLAGQREPVLRPEVEIVDPHHHLWGARDPVPPYLLPDLLADVGDGHRVVGTVFVECMWDYRTGGPEHLSPVGETEAVASAAGEPGSPILGIVSFADLTLGDAVDEVLDAHEEAGQGRFRGIRHATAFDPDPAVRRTHTRPPAGLMGDPAYVAGTRRLAARGLVSDVWLYHHQIPELTALARAVPDGTFVLDHLGGPLGIGPWAGRRDEVFEEWRADLAELATCPNVVVKLGGIGMAVYGCGYGERAQPPTSQDLADDWGDWVRFTIERFGPDRCMFESNFPVDKVGCSYRTLWNSFHRMTDDASDADRIALFRDTAARTYRVTP